MATIRATPKHLFSWGFDLDLGEMSRICLDMAWFREQGRFTWDGTEYQLSREGPWTGDFLLMADDRVLARATKDSVFLRSFTIRLDGRELRFRAAAWLFRRFELIEGDSVVGEIVPDHFLTRACTVDLPEDLAVPVRVFLFWLAAILWRRQSNAAAGS